MGLAGRGLDVGWERSGRRDPGCSSGRTDHGRNAGRGGSSRSPSGVRDTIGGSVSKRTEGERQVWVATDLRGNEFWVGTETRYLVPLVSTDEAGGTLTFDRWGEARTFSKPRKVLTL